MPRVVPLPIPLSIVPSDATSRLPYYLMLLSFAIAFAVVLAVFPSLRKYRMRRNIVVYVAAALVVSLLLFQIDNVGRRAMINIGYEGGATYYPGQVGQIVMGANNFGDRAANFYLVVESVNASFQPEQNFVHVGSTTIKVPFLLQERWSPRNEDKRAVSFAIDEKVTGFSFSVSWEQQGSGELVVASADTEVSFVWNGSQTCYVLDCAARVCA